MSNAEHFLYHTLPHSMNVCMYVHGKDINPSPTESRVKLRLQNKMSEVFPEKSTELVRRK